ncbi:MAG TPA: helix-turn-helix domain-containing protein, partial [Chitinophagales bacterium]|nr:helix-turn-helix domain-containing protein [Chitinophagales bacterium]
IASKRNLAYSTICGHLTKYIANGQIDIEQLITPKQISIIMVALQRVKNQENPNLKMVKDLLPTEIEFHEIRWVLASMENES